MSKVHILQVRLDENELAALAHASARQAMELSTWVRLVSLQAASLLLEKPIEVLVPREPAKVKIVSNPNATIKVGDERVKRVPRPAGVGIAYLKSSGRKVTK